MIPCLSIRFENTKEFIDLLVKAVSTSVTTIRICTIPSVIAFISILMPSWCIFNSNGLPKIQIFTTSSSKPFISCLHGVYGFAILDGRLGDVIQFQQSQEALQSCIGCIGIREEIGRNASGKALCSWNLSDLLDIKMSGWVVLCVVTRFSIFGDSPLPAACFSGY